MKMLILLASPWNTPIFVIRKKSGKWRLLQDLRKVNEIMEVMGPLQPGLPSPVVQNWELLVIDLKDCFFSIPLAPQDCCRFAFSVPATNFDRPFERYEWTVLPQGMANSPTLCQKFVAQVIAPVRERYPDVLLLHYMDDLLLAAPSPGLLQEAFQDLSDLLTNSNLVISPDKVQKVTPFHYLGRLIDSNQVSYKTPVVSTAHLSTLNDFQKFLGDLNWIRPSLKLTTGQLKPLFDMLRGHADPKSPRTLTNEARHALQLVQDALSEQKLNRVTTGVSWCLCILRTSYTPTGLFWQKGILEWLHLSASWPRIATPYHDLVSMLIAKGRLRALTLFGSDPPIVIVPYTTQEQSWLWSFSDSWQLALADFTGQLSCHYPKDKILHFYSRCNLIFPKTCSLQPISQAALAFTDGSSNGLAAGQIDDVPFSFQTPETSAQRVELLAVQHVLSTCGQSVNIYSDSQYVVNLINLLETAPLSFSDSSAIIHLLLPLQQTIRKRTHQFFIGHIRAHTDLPGPLSAGNRNADALTRPVIASALSPLRQAEMSHALHHQGSRSLRLQFQITREQARAIVKQCPACVTHLPQPTHTGVNPRGLQPGHIFQMDVTHIASFGRLKYVHVTIDTFSHFIIASAHTGEAVKDVTAHCLLVFSNLGAPKILKTDNAPAYTSSSFQTFCSQFQVIHKTGIPYNPQGQGIVERAHATLKTLLLKLNNSPPSFYKSPHDVLRHALYVLNFLTLDAEGHSAANRFWHPKGSATPMVL
uniref:Uncharacterized protein n=1 Tax=Callithrix jacchus TaxID=9483 RepID=A0A8I3W2Z1_CALJA